MHFSRSLLNKYAAHIVTEGIKAVRNLMDSDIKFSFTHTSYTDVYCFLIR